MTETVSCQGCSQAVPRALFEERWKVCPKCGYHHPLTAQERLELLVDPGSFEEFDADLYSVDFLNFPRYLERLEAYRKETGLPSEMLTGYAQVGGHRLVIGITDMRFNMGSMGSVVGEKITRCFERAIEGRLPVLIVSGSGAGARMYEGTVALMQMAKTSAAVRRHHEAGLFYISLITHPTMGGTAASFVSLGHVILAEPGAMIGFAGARARAAIGERMPPELQTAESLLKHGMLDAVIPRERLRPALIWLLGFLAGEPPTTDGK
ncbi:MAG: acetyl-coenzyme A carboxylase carboxyl transferase subunit beta [Candidatus Poribacteria bacterium]|nr:MAG: acetyl-coenzyme A carboxylase carboxyl transferase subunit beta [Candidatus Poribacteria bacterium]